MLFQGLRAFAVKGTLILGLLSCLTFIPAELAAQAEPLSESSVAAYLSDHEGEIRSKLATYNKRHRIVAEVGLTYWRVYDLQSTILSTTGDRAWVEMSYKLESLSQTPLSGTVVFELAWEGGEPVFVGHRKDRPSAVPEPVLPAAGSAPPSRPTEAVEAYLREHEREIRDKLGIYNHRQRFVVPPGDEWRIRSYEWKIAGLDGDRVFLELEFVLRNYYESRGDGLFELAWEGDDLVFIGHRNLPKRPPTASGWLSQGGEGCIHNYYAPNPCLDAVRGWTAFSDFHGLRLGPESAKIYQAYKQNSFQLGDRLMARARGLPDPSGESVFGIHAEVRAMNLTKYQTGSDRVGCDLNPYSPHPCPEILEIFRQFAQRHNLPPDAGTATMLEAYSQGNFKRADVIYALRQGLEVPAYGYITTVAGRDVAALWQEIRRINEGQRVPCSNNPYNVDGTDSTKTCPEITRLWRDFAKRYQLADNEEMGRIFDQYARGEFRAGDQLLAQAKGVSLEQLLEAAGVPTSKGLVIEVFPGLKRVFQKGRTGV